MKSVRLKFETQNSGDQKLGVKTFMLKRKNILEVKQNGTKLELKSEKNEMHFKIGKLFPGGQV